MANSDLQPFPDEKRPPNTFPFCNTTFMKLGNHLRHCKQRNGADYTIYLSHKTLTKKTKAKPKLCPHCRKKFSRLDIHLRNRADCKIPVQASPVDNHIFPQGETPLIQQGDPGPEAAVPASVLHSQIIPAWVSITSGTLILLICHALFKHIHLSNYRKHLMNGGWQMRICQYLWFLQFHPAVQ